MYPAENKWQSLAQHNTFDLSNKFEVQIAIVKPPDGPPHVSIRKYAKYLTSSERKQGISVHEINVIKLREQSNGKDGEIDKQSTRCLFHLFLNSIKKQNAVCQ